MIINYFVEDERIFGGHSLRVAADVGESEESEVRGGKPSIGIALSSIAICHQKKDIEVPLDLFTPAELGIIEQLGLGE